MRQRRIYTPEDIREGATICLAGEGARRIVKVLRLRRGDRITLFNGTGMEGEGEIAGIRGSKVDCIIRGTNRGRVSEIDIGVLIALPRVTRMEWFLEKGSELGVRRVYPIIARRSRYPLTKGEIETISPGRMERWRRISRESSAQCGRSDIMEVLLPANLKRAIDGLPAGGVRLLLDPSSKRAVSEFLKGLMPAGPGRFLVMVGPEGGWSGEEVDEGVAAGFEPVNCGWRVLRTETAGVFIVSLLTGLFGGDRGEPCAG